MALIPCDGVLRRHSGTDNTDEEGRRRRREGGHVYQPREKKPVLSLTPQTGSLKNYENNFCRLSHPICGTLYGSPNKQVTNTIFWSEITEDLEHPWFLFNQLQSQDIILMGRHLLGNTVQLLKQSIIF